MAKIRPNRIAGGFIKLATNKEDDFSNDRKSICDQCEHRLAGICTICGCFTNAKVKEKNENCPINKWNDMKTVKELGVIVGNMSQGVITLSHVEKTKVVDLTFDKNLKKGHPTPFQVRIVNDRGNGIFQEEAMKNINIKVGCGACTKISNIDDVPKVLADGEHFDLKVIYTPNALGKVKKTIRVVFNQNEILIINFKSTVEK
jgi:hypothetical protein